MDPVKYIYDHLILFHAASLSHCLATLILLFKLLHTKSCAGVSRRSQILMAIVSTRYLDLYSTYITSFGALMEEVSLVTSYGTLLLMYCAFGKTHDSKNDTFRIELLILPAGLLACFVNPEFTVIEVFLSFSISLEVVAILPQLLMNFNLGKIDKTVAYYLLALCSYHALHWLHYLCYYMLHRDEDSTEVFSLLIRLIQILLYCGFFFVGKEGGSNETSGDVESRGCTKDGDIITGSGFLDHVPAEKDECQMPLKPNADSVSDISMESGTS